MIERLSKEFLVMYLAVRRSLYSGTECHA